MTSEMKSGLKTATVIGTLPGTTDEDIWIVAHMDGYFDGAIDNGSGLAVMMGLAEHFAKVPPSERKRNLIFMGSAGHHGGPGARWLHDERATVLAKTALIINLEHVSAVRTKYWGPHLRKTNAVAPMRWWVWGSKPLLDVAVKSFARFNVGLTADMDTGASGEIGQVARDAPSMQVIKSGALSITTTWTKRVTGAGVGLSVVLGGVATGVATLTDGLTPAVGAALVGGIALVASATALALAIFVKADLDARGRATAARHAGRAEVAAAFLAATAPRPAPVDVDTVAAAVESIRKEQAAADAAKAQQARSEDLAANLAAGTALLWDYLRAWGDVVTRLQASTGGAPVTGGTATGGASASSPLDSATGG